MGSSLVSCIDCTEQERIFSSVYELEAHIASDHLNFCPFECEKCRYAKFPTEYALISHCKNDHGLMEFQIKYRYTPEYESKKNELAERVQRCVKIYESTTFASSSEGPSHSIKMEEAPPIPTASPTLEQYTASSSSPVLSLSEEDAKKSVRSFLMASNSESSRDTRIEKIAKAVQLDCAICGETIANQRSSMIYHANTRHSKYDMYQCGICKKTWQTIAKSDVVKHVKTHHENEKGADDLSMVIDNRKKMAQKLKIATLKCFPYKKWRSKPLSSGTSPPSRIGNQETMAMEDYDLDEAMRE